MPRTEDAERLRDVIIALSCIADRLESGEMEVLSGDITVTAEGKESGCISTGMTAKDAIGIGEVYVVSDLRVKESEVPQ